MADTEDDYTAPKTLGHVLVTGGCGFLGHHIVSLLLSRGAATQISVLDLSVTRNRFPGVSYHAGDITSYESTKSLFATLKPDVVIHTASPLFNANAPALMYKVNAEGTRTIVKAAQETGVKALVYTSSASVVSDTKSDLICADEDAPRVVGDQQPEYYTTTKALAEIHVLSANRTPSTFLTAAIRPSALYGPGDVQLLPPMLTALKKRQTAFQIGPNDNLFDFTYIVNAAYAHILAASALLATADREAAGYSMPLDFERVDGEPFFITNDAPVYFWDFARMVWRAAGDTTRPSDVWILPQGFALLLASIIEWVFWIFRLGKPNLTRQQVRYSCMARWFSVEKAKRRLGYRPVVGLEEGIQRAVNDLVEKERGRDGEEGRKKVL
ncbi:erg26, C-3 sterol dehydrogenase [Cryomyces antarcticus]|uniref:Erg26, C-3 sterol dehydrogenase n=1 Tax=Cryomyces antarcticus TaxID=329879 RepID=A0ABR0LYZ5_9PEZI|nr:erg26, C-3 sterol dehydrogenase [Cryomyces antarcticus]